MPATIIMWPPALVWPGFAGNAQTTGELPPLATVTQNLRALGFESAAPVADAVLPTQAFERRIREGLKQIVFATPLGATRPLVEGTFAMSANYRIFPVGPPREVSPSAVLFRFTNVRIEDGRLAIDVEDLDVARTRAFYLCRDESFSSDAAAIEAKERDWIDSFDLDARGMPIRGNR